MTRDPGFLGSVFWSCFLVVDSAFNHGYLFTQEGFAAKSPGSR